MGALLTGAIVLFAAGTDVQFDPLQLLLELLAALAGIGGLVAGAVAIYKARSDKDLTNTQAMSLLFEKQREVNLDLLAQREAEIAELKHTLEAAHGGREDLRERLRACEQERTVLANQLQGLQRTLDELHRSAEQGRHGRGRHNT